MSHEDQIDYAAALITVLILLVTILVLIPGAWYFLKSTFCWINPENVRCMQRCGWF